MASETQKTDLKSFTFDELSAFFTSLGEPSYRAKQVFTWAYRGVASFDEMTDLSKGLREKLKEKAILMNLEIERKQVSKDGTVKYLYKLKDGYCIESVIMQYKHGNTICISTQAGCRMGCTFCASTVNGLERNLTPGEIIDQIILAQNDLKIRISNIVLMGMGEPLDNYENVIKFLMIVNDKNGLNIGMRHISLSTCGICDKIEKLMDLNLGLTLSVSLHAPNDQLRSQLMPVNKKYNLERLMATCREYANHTKRRISFEYALVQGKNDTKQHAYELSRLLKGMLCHVNIIPVNPTDYNKLKPYDEKNAYRFAEMLNQNGLNATVRRRLGRDIDAACGQLKGRYMSEK